MINKQINGMFLIHLKLTSRNVKSFFEHNEFYPGNNASFFDSNSYLNEIPYQFVGNEEGNYIFYVHDDVKNKYDNLKKEFTSDDSAKYISLLPINPLKTSTTTVGEDKYEFYTKGYRCRLSEVLHQSFKSIFLDTYVKYRNNEKWQDHESENALFAFNVKKKAVLLFKLDINNLETRNYKKCLRDIIAYQGFHAIDNQDNHVKSLVSKEEYGLKDNAKEEEKQLFLEESRWRRVEELEKIKKGDCKFVLYMLWDDNSKAYYIGKAEDLRTRLDQHRKNKSDSIKNFTHFRYSKLNKNYQHLIYMLEMHEIHTAGWILSTPCSENNSLQHLPNSSLDKLPIMINSKDKYHSPDIIP